MKKTYKEVTNVTDREIEKRLAAMGGKGEAILREAFRAPLGEAERERLGVSRQWVHELVSEFVAGFSDWAPLEEHMDRIYEFRPSYNSERGLYYIDTRMWSRDFPLFYARYLGTFYGGHMRRHFLVTSDDRKLNPRTELIALAERLGFPLQLGPEVEPAGTVWRPRFLYLSDEGREEWILKGNEIVGRRSFSFMKHFCFYRRRYPAMGVWELYERLLEEAPEYLEAGRIETPRRFAAQLQGWMSLSAKMEEPCRLELLVSKKEPGKILPFSIYEAAGWIERHADEVDAVYRHVDRIVRLDDAVEWRRQRAAEEKEEGNG